MPGPVATLTARGAFGVLKRLFKTPSQKRAGGPANQLVASANAGNVTAAAAIIHRTTLGIQKERAVWLAALQRVSSDMVLAAQRFKNRLPPVDHSGPEAAARSAIAQAVDVATLATQTSARETPRAEGKPQKRQPSSEQRREFGRRSSATRSARPTRGTRTRVRKVWRYNPDTNRRTQVAADSPEADAWPSRKPPRRTKAQQRAEREATSAVRRGVGRAARAVGSVGAAGVSYAAIAGLVAYGVTRSIMQSHAEGETPAFLFSLAVAKAHRDAAARLGRQVTRAELLDIRKRIANRLQDAIDAGTSPPPIGAVKTLISRLRGR